MVEQKRGAARASGGICTSWGIESIKKLYMFLEKARQDFSAVRRSRGFLPVEAMDKGLQGQQNRKSTPTSGGERRHLSSLQAIGRSRVKRTATTCIGTDPCTTGTSCKMSFSVIPSQTTPPLIGLEILEAMEATLGSTRQSPRAHLRCLGLTLPLIK